MDRRRALAFLAIGLGQALPAARVRAETGCRSYEPGARIDEDIFVQDAEQQAISLLSLLKRRVNVLVIFGGAEHRTPPRLWCGDSRRELPMLKRLQARFAGRGVGYVPVAVTPAYSESAHGYPDGTFLKTPESDPSYVTAVASFIAETEKLREAREIAFESVYYDPRFRMLDNPKQGPHVAAYGRVFPWQGRFKPCEDTQRHGTPVMWLLGMDGAVLGPPFWGNVYEGSDKATRYHLEDVVGAIEQALGEGIAMSNEVVILGGARTPIGSFGGAFKDVSAVQLGVVAVQEALKRSGVRPDQVHETILGCILQAGAGMNPARQVAIKAGMPETVPAHTVNKVCGSGLKAVMLAAQAIKAGDAQVVVAGGAESMSGAPFLLPGARWGERLGHGKVVDHMLHEGLTDAFSDVHMGITAENLVERYGLTRDDQDLFAVESQQRAAAAIREGRFKDEIVAVAIPQKKGEPKLVDTDEYPRPDTTLDALSRLKPAFKKNGTVTAGNSSGLNDGAAALVIASADRAKALGREPLARIVSYAAVGVDPKIMGIGPVPAVRKALEKASLKLSDIELFELNEAFAAQSLAVLRELKLDPAKVNLNGGAIALGHPIGASGARILVTLLYAMKARGAKRGLAGLCIGGGQGVAMIVERV